MKLFGKLLPVLSGVYLVALTALLVYSLYALWPPPATYDDPDRTVKLTVDNPGSPAISGSVARYLVRVNSDGVAPDTIQFSLQGFSESQKAEITPPTVQDASGSVSVVVGIDAKALDNGTYLALIQAKRGTARGETGVAFGVDKHVPRPLKASEEILPKSSPSDVKRTENRDPRPAKYFMWKGMLFNEARLWLIVLICGSLGSTVHAIRSFYWYCGNRGLKPWWLPQYFLLPLAGGILGLGVYFVMRGGFFAANGGTGESTPHTYAALAFLIGMFSDQTVSKLLQVFELVFTPRNQGKDTVPPSGSRPNTQENSNGSSAETPDFSVTIAPNDVVVKPGEKAEITVTLTALNAFNGTVTLTGDLAPEKLGSAQGRCTFTPKDVQFDVAEKSVKLQIDTTDLPEEVYPFTISATSGTTTKTQSGKFTVRAE